MKIIECFTFFIIVSFLSCSGIKNIKITTEYILNENWHKEWSRPLMVEKLRVKRDSVINPFSDLSQGEILDKLMEDSLFRWSADANSSKRREEIYKTKKVYFNKDNGFTWLDEVAGRNTVILGNLEKDTWYKFSGLIGYPYFVYVYIDSIKQVYRFDVNMANY